MRYVGLLLFFLCIPVVASMLRTNPASRRWVWMLLGASPYIYGWAHLSVAIVSWAYWPGYVKGLVVALPDLLALGLLFSAPKRRVRSGILIAFCCYIVAAALSIAAADVPFASFQYVWQLLRVLLVVLAVARVSAGAGADAPRHIIYGMCGGVAFQAFFSVLQHYGQGVLQASGTMGHQNLLGMMTHFALLTALALMLAGDRAMILKVGVGAAMVAVALTGSRGTVGFAAMGVVALLLLSLIRRPTAKKMRVAGAGVAILLALAPVAYLTLEKRFAKTSDVGSNEERAAFERAARFMWADHPMGVGANEYVIAVNTGGYSNRAGVVWSYGSRSANVHNVFLLIAAETGWPGIITFLILYATAILTALRAAWARPRGAQGELLLGVAVTLVTVAVHSMYEWIFIYDVTQYLFGMLLGLAMGVGTGGVARRSRATVEQLRQQPEMVAAR